MPVQSRQTSLKIKTNAVSKLMRISDPTLKIILTSLRTKDSCFYFSLRRAESFGNEDCLEILLHLNPWVTHASSDLELSPLLWFQSGDFI